MSNIDIRQHAKKQEEQVRTILKEMADATLELDMLHENGLNTSAYIDYDEQDMLNAATILFHVCGNYAIKHELFNEYNVDEKINDFREMLKDTFGLDTIQEVRASIMLSQIKNGLS